ncbi:MAG: LamB/YcsF family protein [Alphaproteobacteria bacterium]
MHSIDLNADLGEAFGPWRMGDDEAMLKVVTSASIACGGHAGDPETMYKTTLLARKNNVLIGAHPGFPDKQGFGRRRFPITTQEIERVIATQLGALMGAAALADGKVSYVKPHGALANWAAEDQYVADAIVRAIRLVAPSLSVLAISGTELELAARKSNLATYSEIFADRAYDSRGHLVSRQQPGAMISDKRQMVERLLRFFETQKMRTIDGQDIELKADSICIHGDTPDAVIAAKHLRCALENAGLTIRAFMNSS